MHSKHVFPAHFTLIRKTLKETNIQEKRISTVKKSFSRACKTESGNPSTKKKNINFHIQAWTFLQVDSVFFSFCSDMDDLHDLKLFCSQREK